MREGSRIINFKSKSILLSKNSEELQDETQERRSGRRSLIYFSFFLNDWDVRRLFLGLIKSFVTRSLGRRRPSVPGQTLKHPKSNGGTDRSFRKARLRLQTIPGASQTLLGLRHAFLPHQYPIWCPVHTYPNNYESATFPFRIQLPSTLIQWIRQMNPQLFKSALQVPWVPETFLARFPVSVKS